MAKKKLEKKSSGNIGKDRSVISEEMARNPRYSYPTTYSSLSIYTIPLFHYYTIPLTVSNLEKREEIQKNLCGNNVGIV
jgi:hypothetical protein